jgi:hypothetical protein
MVHGLTQTDTTAPIGLPSSSKHAGAGLAFWPICRHKCEAGDKHPRRRFERKLKPEAILILLNVVDNVGENNLIEGSPGPRHGWIILPQLYFWDVPSTTFPVIGLANPVPVVADAHHKGFKRSVPSEINTCIIQV